MKNTDRDSANTDPKNEWQYAKNEDSEMFHAMGSYGDPDDEDEDDETEEEKEENRKDWGHIDPAEGNSPFPDSNDPSAPGSAV